MSADRAAPAPPSGTKPIPTRRQQYRAIDNEYLSFQFSRSAPSLSGASLSRRPHRAAALRSAQAFSKERYVQANFRFVACAELAKQIPRDPDQMISWSDVELVIVPISADSISCPICLDVPVAPRLTRCGHYFCWPCLLQFASATATSGAGVWRSCPICFESINFKQSEGVHFQPVADYFGASSATLQNAGIPMRLMRRPIDSLSVEAASFDGANGADATSNSKAGRLEDLSPFAKVSYVSCEFIRQEIFGRNRRQLFDFMLQLGPDADDSFVQTALKMLDEREQSLVKRVAQTIEPEKTVSLVATSSILSLSNPTFQSKSLVSFAIYFHQSVDGQSLFLCPLNIKILRRQFGEYSAFPPSLCAPVLEIESLIMTEDLRRRYRQLSHLPLGCQFGLCEMDLSSIVSPDVSREFEEELALRATQRRAKLQMEEQRRADSQRLEAAEIAVMIMSESMPVLPVRHLPSVASSIGSTEQFPVLGANAASSSPSPPSRSAAASFASIAANATSSSSSIAISSSAFEFSLEDVVLTKPGVAASTAKKPSKQRYQLVVSTTHRRQHH